MNSIKRILIEIFIILSIIAVFSVISIRKVDADYSSVKDFATRFSYSTYLNLKIGTKVGPSDGHMTEMMVCCGHQISSSVENGTYQVTDKGEFGPNTLASIVCYYHKGYGVDGHTNTQWRKYAGLLCWC